MKNRIVMREERRRAPSGTDVAVTEGTPSVTPDVELILARRSLLTRRQRLKATRAQMAQHIPSASIFQGIADQHRADRKGRTASIIDTCHVAPPR